MNIQDKIKEFSDAPVTVLLWKDIKTDVNARSSTNADRVNQLMESAETSGPVWVMRFPNGELHLVDGYHRYDAFYNGLKHDSVRAKIAEGTAEEAYIISFAVNAWSSLPFSKRDITKYVQEIIKLHPDWSPSKLSKEFCGSKISHDKIKKEMMVLRQDGIIPKYDKLMGIDGKEYPIAFVDVEKPYVDINYITDGQTSDMNKALLEYNRKTNEAYENKQEDRNDAVTPDDIPDGFANTAYAERKVTTPPYNVMSSPPKFEETLDIGKDFPRGEQGDYRVVKHKNGALTIYWSKLAIPQRFIYIYPKLVREILEWSDGAK